MTNQQLTELCEKEKGVIIAQDRTDNKIVGLLLGASWQFLEPWPMFKHMAGILNEFNFQGKKLDAFTSYQYGPICIAEEYRSLGIGESLLAYQKQVFAARYPIIVTFVNVINPRSYAFHTRNKFEDIGFFKFNGNQYHMMAIPTLA